MPMYFLNIPNHVISLNINLYINNGLKLSYFAFILMGLNVIMNIMLSFS